GIDVRERRWRDRRGRRGRGIRIPGERPEETVSDAARVVEQSESRNARRRDTRCAAAPVRDAGAGKRSARAGRGLELAGRPQEIIVGPVLSDRPGDIMRSLLFVVLFAFVLSIPMPAQQPPAAPAAPAGAGL